MGGGDGGSAGACARRVWRLRLGKKKGVRARGRGRGGGKKKERGRGNGRDRGEGRRDEGRKEGKGGKEGEERREVGDQSDDKLLADREQGSIGTRKWRRQRTER